jgi:endonuclease-3
MNMKQKTAKISAALKQLYPEVKCALTYTKPHELLVAARLSAQCTDKRVNIITPALFARYGSVADFAGADKAKVEKYVRSCGLYKTKASDIVETCKILQSDYGGRIPDSVEELVKLPGIGRKTANLLAGTLYGKPAVVTDTHVIRLSNRLGLASSKEPVKVENALRELLSERESLNFCHRLVFFGREVCKAQRPLCENCVLKAFCGYVASSAKSPKASRKP